MGCEQGTINNNCSSKQSFCSLNKQSVQDNPINYTLPTFNQNELITATDWNKIYDILKNIYNYGERGPQQPSITGLTNIQANNNIILLNLYNDILARLGKNNLSNTQIITKNLMNTLQDYIKTYQLHPDRCVSCNTACNSECEAASQGCGEPCYCVQYDCSLGCSWDCGNKIM